MQIERFLIEGCCNSTKIVFKLDRPITTSLLEALRANGFIENKPFTLAGMIYVENKDIIVSGSFGNNKLNAKCKKKQCDQMLNDFEQLLINIP